MTGNYLTTSKDGTINYWTQNFELQKSEKSKNRNGPVFNRIELGEKIIMILFVANLRVSKTWVLDCICLPDVRVVCTSSIESDLRFYDTSANNFNARIIITRLPFAVNTMAYWFGETEQTDCKIILGDRGGNVMMLEFCPELRGPFQSKPGTALLQTTWKELLKVCRIYFVFFFCTANAQFRFVLGKNPIAKSYGIFWHSQGHCTTGGL